jgi:hypothetical protein
MAWHELPLRGLRRHAGDHRSPQSGRHARINILAITVITDWPGSGPHTWPISQSTTTSPAQHDQTDEPPIFRRFIIPGTTYLEKTPTASSRALTLLSGYFPYL